MSTRCNIQIHGHKNIHIYYQHFDGYPKNIHPIIGNLLKEIIKYKTDEIEDACAIGDLILKLNNSNKYYCELEYVEEINPDIDYLYIINIPNKTMRTFEINNIPIRYADFFPME